MYLIIFFLIIPTIRYNCHYILLSILTLGHVHLDTSCTTLVHWITHSGFIFSYAAVTHRHVHLYTTRTTYTGLYIGGFIRSHVATSVDCCLCIHNLTPNLNPPRLFEYTSSTSWGECSILEERRIIDFTELSIF